MEVTVQGSLLRVDGREAILDLEERGLARLLTEFPDETVAGAALGERLWRLAPPAGGPGNIEAAVGRLKAKLGDAAPAIVSPSPGTYRWVATRVPGTVEPAGHD